MILVTGGARSGKSLFAENLLKEVEGNILYIATAIPFDEEMKLRVKKHKLQRPENWDTFEAYQDLGKSLLTVEKEYVGILIDCLTILVSNLLLEENIYEEIKGSEIEKIEIKILREVSALVEAVQKIKGKTVIVTNELGSGIVPENKLARIFRDIAGKANQLVAQSADEVYLAVSGIPIKIK